MVLFKGDFKSKELSKRTPISVILPADNIEFLENSDTTKKPPYRTLYLLHGMFSNNETFLYNTQIRAFAERNNMAVVLPSCGNSFYLNKPQTFENYTNYVGKELVDFTRKIFPLSNKKEDTFIAGFSMGGYGSIRTGLLYNDTFGAIGAISPALITHRLDGVIEEYKHILDSKEFIEYCFEDFDNVRNSDMDPEYLINNLNGEIPKLFIAIGKDDFLINENRHFYNFLKEKNIEVEYGEFEGSHTWDFCNTHINRFIEWLK